MVVCAHEHSGLFQRTGELIETESACKHCLTADEEGVCAAVKSAEPLAKEQLSKAEEFTRAFKDNLSKEMEQVMKNNQKPGGGSSPPRP